MAGIVHERLSAYSRAARSFFVIHANQNAEALEWFARNMGNGIADDLRTKTFSEADYEAFVTSTYGGILQAATLHIKGRDWVPDAPAWYAIIRKQKEL